MVRLNSVSICVIGGDDDASEVLYSGLKLFPAEKAILLSTSEHKRNAEEIASELQKFKIPVEKRVLEAISFENFFKTISEIKQDNPEKNLVLNVDTDYRTSCIALSAAFTNGVQAIGIMDDKVIAYPIMKFSYYTALSDKKLSLLKTIAERGSVGSLEELSKMTGMSLPLVLYHVRGSKQKPGLEELGLVHTLRKAGKISVALSTLGRLIEQGHVQVQNDKTKKSRVQKLKRHQPNNSCNTAQKRSNFRPTKILTLSAGFRL